MGVCLSTASSTTASHLGSLSVFSLPALAGGTGCLPFNGGCCFALARMEGGDGGVKLTAAQGCVTHKTGVQLNEGINLGQVRIHSSGYPLRGPPKQESTWEEYMGNAENLRSMHYGWPEHQI